MSTITLPTTTTYERVQLDASGTPVIVGTTMKVIELVMAQMAHGWNPEELHFQHPYLTLGQIYKEVTNATGRLLRLSGS